MSELVRLILLVGNAVFLAWLAYIAATAEGPSTTTKDPLFWLGYGILTTLALNFLYLLLVPPGDLSRIFRLIGLWFDAKLRKRAQNKE
jgi:hypothetical protein